MQAEYIVQNDYEEVAICMKNRWMICLLALFLCASPVCAATCGEQGDCTAKALCEEELELSAEWMSEGSIRVSWNREACASVLTVVRLYRDGKRAACEWRRACRPGGARAPLPGGARAPLRSPLLPAFFGHRFDPQNASREGRTIRILP